jgi:hypothetical protein
MGVGILRVNVKGYNWDMQLFAEGMSACHFEHIPEGAMGWRILNGLYVFVTSTYTHKNQIPNVKNI